MKLAHWLMLAFASVSTGCCTYYGLPSCNPADCAIQIPESASAEAPADATPEVQVPPQTLARARY